MEDSFELIAMQILSFAGDAKADAYMALKSAKKGDFEESDKLLDQSENKMNESHKIHLKLLGTENKFSSVNEQLLVTHAMDTLMTSMSEINLISELIDLIKEKGR